MLPKAEKTDVGWETLETAVMKRKVMLLTKTKGGGKKASAKGKYNQA